MKRTYQPSKIRRKRQHGFSEPDAHQEWPRHLESTSSGRPQAPHSVLIISGWQLEATHSESSYKETVWQASKNSVFRRIPTCEGKRPKMGTGMPDRELVGGNQQALFKAWGHHQPENR
jgi:hypothetical protein